MDGRSCSVTLTSVVMKSFERLVLFQLKAITDPLQDLLQFSDRAERSGKNGRRFYVLILSTLRCSLSFSGSDSTCR